MYTNSLRATGFLLPATGISYLTNTMSSFLIIVGTLLVAGVVLLAFRRRSLGRHGLQRVAPKHLA
jgi:LPXTG-motif cell wall-anchored protein